MAQVTFPAPSTGGGLQLSNGPLTALPAGLTLRNTYTSSTTGITGQPSVVCVVLVGGGAAGGGTAGGNTSVNTSPFYAPGAPGAVPGRVILSATPAITNYSIDQTAVAPQALSTSGDQNDDQGLQRTGYNGTAASTTGVPTLGAGGGSGWYADQGKFNGGNGGTPSSTMMGLTVTGVGGTGQTLGGSGLYRSGGGGGGGGLTGSGGNGAVNSTAGGAGGNGTGIGSGGAGAGGQASTGNGGFGGGAGGLIIMNVPAFSSCTVGAGGTGAVSASGKHGNGAPGAVLVYW
jgi:hypothetical protein